REAAGKNGADPWVHVFREAWLRNLCFDFEGAQQLSTVIMRSNAEQHAVQPRTIATVASGYAELDRGRLREALHHFADVRDPRVTPGFFLHWYWRIQAQIGTCAVCLRAEDITTARREADGLLACALSTGVPNLHALAWEMNARVAAAEEDWSRAKKDIEQALAVVDAFEIPATSWRVHSTAWDIFSRTNRSDAEA